MFQAPIRRRLNVEALEFRKLMAADLSSNAGMSLDSGPMVTEASFSWPTGLFDKTLSAKVQPNRYVAAKNELVIDGSDYEDRITIRQFIPGILNDQVALELSQWDGATLVSSQSYVMNCGKLASTGILTLFVIGKDGGDRITNLTSLKMYAEGGRGNDVMAAGSNGDTMHGNSGINHISGGAGIDFLYGGEFTDTIIGWGGDDHLYGNGGDDFIYGDSTNNDSTIAIGFDDIDGGEGNDKIWGGRGDDEIYGRNGNDEVWAGMGNDKVWGGAGYDHLYGEKGNDFLWGEADLDYLFGGDDSDRLDGGYGGAGGVDYLVGGAGRDTFFRHLSVFGGFGTDDGDIFADYNPFDDTINEELHW